MLVSYRQPLGYRQPLHVGWTRYCRLWLDHHTNTVREGIRPGWRLVSGAAAEILWVTRLSMASAVARFERARPDPWSDRQLLKAALVTGMGALVVAVLLGSALAEWMMTRMDDVLLASSGALVVGVAFFLLTYLVFASRDRESKRAEER